MAENVDIPSVDSKDVTKETITTDQGVKKEIETILLDEYEQEKRNIEWSDGIGSRGRRSYLLFLKGDEIVLFEGNNIDDICVVKGSDFTKNGKWSHNDYRIVLAKGVKSIPFSSGWETGSFLEGISQSMIGGTPDTWSDLSTLLGISVPSLKEFLYKFKPLEAKKIDEVDNALESLEENADEESEIVTVSFGSPSNRAIKEGFWESPKKVNGYDAEIRLINLSEGWYKENIEVVGLRGKVLSVKHSRGMHGGYYSVSLGIIENTPNEDIKKIEDYSFNNTNKQVLETSMGAAFAKLNLKGRK